MTKQYTKRDILIGQTIESLPAIIKTVDAEIRRLRPHYSAAQIAAIKRTAMEKYLNIKLT